MKAVMTIQELKAEGYPETELRNIAHSQDFKKVGFRGSGKKSKIYFFTDKLNKFLERRTQNGNTCTDNRKIRLREEHVDA